MLPWWNKLHDRDELLERRRRRSWVLICEIWWKLHSVSITSVSTTKCCIDRGYASNKHFKLEMERSHKQNPISPNHGSDNLRLHSIWQVWPHIAFLDLLHSLRGLDLVLHRFGSAARFHYFYNARLAFLTTCHTFCEQDNHGHVHRRDSPHLLAFLDDIIFGHNSLVHLAVAQANELTKWIKRYY